MKRLTGNEMREIWFDFWKTKDHEIISSAPLIPINDNSLLWINAGITPLKSYFDGTKTPKNKRIVSSQKCIRTNDIENVGVTSRHHTFFEMLGNFSIGDYFKKEALAWALEFLTSPQWLNIPVEKLYMTIYPKDLEAKEIWLSLGIDPEHIIEQEDNYWEIGEGPCGPDSEIFFDRGEEYDKEKIGIKLLKDDLENNRYIEIWNNVFSQYNATLGLSRERYPELPNKNIDTGMGLERMLTILQDVETNYDTDIFAPLMYKISELSNTEYIGQASFKIIADHLRTITFALADGANFGNTGRNYVLRRLLRRAIRHGKKIGMENLFAEELVEPIVKTMGEHYEEIKLEQESIKRKIKREEELFNQTLNDGLKRLDEIIYTSTIKEITPEEVFKLYDTYGLPFELTEEYANEFGFKVSKIKAEEYLEQQKSLSKNNSFTNEVMSTQNKELLEFKIPSVFTGYEELNATSEVIGLFDGKIFNKESEANIFIVLNKTPYYEESGGQISDKATIIINNKVYNIISAFTGPNKQVFHQIELDQRLKLGDKVKIEIDEDYRNSIMKNHSAAHLLQYALKKVLGEDTFQAGSRIDSETLRFDFTYDFKIDDEQLLEIEKIVNAEIKKETDIITTITNIEEAEKLGAIALFEDRYGDTVRVLNIGQSTELCGGTHVKNLKEINKFSIASLENKGSSTYRIIASTDKNIEKIMREAINPYNDVMLETLKKAKNVINEAKEIGINLEFNFEIDNDAPISYKDVLKNKKEMNELKLSLEKLEKSYQKEKEQIVIEQIDTYLEKVEKINNINTLLITFENIDTKTLKKVIDEMSNRLENSFIFIANINGENVNFLAKTTNNLKNKINVGDIIKDASVKSNGDGGGSSTFAQGGGTTITYVDQIIKQIRLDLNN